MLNSLPMPQDLVSVNDANVAQLRREIAGPTQPSVRPPPRAALGRSPAGPNGPAPGGGAQVPAGPVP